MLLWKRAHFYKLYLSNEKVEWIVNVLIKRKKNYNYVWQLMLTTFTAMIVSYYVHISHHYIVLLKLI